MDTTSIDAAAGHAFIEWIKKSSSSIGGLSGIYPIGNQFLSASTSGVGTKILIAEEMQQYSGIGIDLVAIAANDVICCGAKPLFFLDYLAMNKLDHEKAQAVMGGILEGCAMAGCHLLGGETAEVPGCYSSSGYSAAGFCVGIVEQNAIIEGKGIAVGDAVIGLRAASLHCSGFPLVQKVIKEQALDLGDIIVEDLTLGDFLLEPTEIYVGDVMAAIKACPIKGMTHITGGGLPDSILRVLPKGHGCLLNTEMWDLPEIYYFFLEETDLQIEEMVPVFNLGIGFVFICDPKDVSSVIKAVPDAIEIGIVTEKEGLEFR